MQKPINKDRAGSFVDLIFHWRSALSDFHDDVNVVGRIGARWDASEIHLSSRRKAIAVTDLVVADAGRFSRLCAV